MQDDPPDRGGDGSAGWNIARAPQAPDCVYSGAGVTLCCNWCAKPGSGAHEVGIQGESRAKPGSGAHGTLQLMLLVCKMGCFCTREEG